MRSYVLNKRNTEEYVKRITLGGNASFGEIRSCIQFETEEEANNWKNGLTCSGYVDVVPIEITVLKDSDETAAADRDKKIDHNEKVERDLESYKKEYEKVNNNLAKAYQEINLCHETIVEQAKEIWHYRHANEEHSKERLV